MKSQIATSRSDWGGKRKLPLVFTEHGALQAANVLNSAQANKMSVFIVRAFVRLREMALAHEKLGRKDQQSLELDKKYQADLKNIDKLAGIFHVSKEAMTIAVMNYWKHSRKNKK